ncbi:hypothetical protein SAMN04489713_12185 [Actinomadura madurae]|uniref:Uncharacterized protein n=1 Tax=Actinomadura madurae TaxID=1993 RepID=A0A1I5VDN6_9ACTN|nr:hypothetical protein [Actinomadura madurae]SFQ05457.1 hypothetical protein SAMN04489713_12185 [Actinomadura madurae]
MTGASERPAARTAFRAIKLLVGCYVAVSLGAIAVLGVLHGHPSVAPQEAWAHAVIVAVTATLMMASSVQAAKGSASAYRRLRIASSVMLAAIVVITAIPGDFPLWMKSEGVFCGVLLCGVVVIANGRPLRDAFSG